MNAQPALGFQETLTRVVGEMARALAERVGESKQQQFVRLQAAVNVIMAFLPRDSIEAMLAGHILLFHEMLVDTVGDSFRGKVNEARPPIRGGIVALDRAFGQNFRRLMDYQKRQDQGRRDELRAVPAQPPSAAPREAAIVVQTPRPAARPPAETPIVPPLNRAARRAAKKRAYTEQRAARAQASAVQGLRPASEPAETPPTVAAVCPESAGRAHIPTEEALAALHANPLAMAALEAGDPVAFARALGIDEPSEDFLAAAAQPGSPFDNHAWSKDAAGEDVPNSKLLSVP